MIKSIIITGAGSGIGQCLAHQMADENIQVLAIGRQEHALKETAGYNPEHIKTLATDVSTDSGLEQIYQAAVNLPKPLSLFQGAGIFQIGKLSEISKAKWLQSFNINVTARLLLTQKLMPLLSGGRILFIGSDAGKKIREGASAYSVAQSASETLVEALKLEMASTDRPIGFFKPGLVETNMVETFLKTPEEDFPAVKFYRDWIAKGQITLPETAASFAKWLILKTSPEDFIKQQWDIREEWHQNQWLKGNLYKSSTLGEA